MRKTDSRWWVTPDFLQWKLGVEYGDYDFPYFMFPSETVQFEISPGWSFSKKRGWTYIDPNPMCLIGTTL